MVNFSLCILALLVVGATCMKTEEEVQDFFMKLGVTCTAEHPLNSKEIKLLQQLKVPKSENTKCFIACIFKKADWMNENGKFNVESALNMVKSYEDTEKAGRAEKLIDTCKAVNDEAVNDGEKGCDRAVHLYKCLTENSPKFNFNVENFKL